MKKTAIFIFFLFIIKIGLTQSEDYKSSISLNFGYSFAEELLVGSAVNEISTNALPVVLIGYDYQINKRFSIGAAASSQVLYLNYSNYGSNQDDFKITYIINTYTARGLVHYALDYKIKMYSGLRLGAVDYMAYTNYNSFEERLSTDFAMTKPFDIAIQTILLGMRTKLTDRLGANMELCTGQPYFVSLGLTYSL
ncbi:MAG: hypothetical protein C0599_02890 [Salinivirgaceae bacterium]|nr:MAG: hypothetical protein C0599_02890 [Salinivirgaceae bacterium]